jgi:hypothetical protein
MRAMSSGYLDSKRGNERNDNQELALHFSNPPNCTTDNKADSSERHQILESRMFMISTTSNFC